MIVEDFYVLVNNFNEFYINVGLIVVKKVLVFVSEYGLIFWINISDEDSVKFRFYFVIEEDVLKIIKNFLFNKVFGYDKVIVRVLKDSLFVIV